MVIKIIRRYWAVLLASILVTGALILIPGHAQPPAYAQAQPTPGPSLTSSSLRTVSVTGNGSMDVAPDIAIVVVGVQNDAQTASQALTQNNTQMQGVVSALQKAGVANADIQTAAVQLFPRPENPPQQQQGQQATPTIQPPGFTAVNTVQVKVRKLDSLGTLLDQVVEAGGNQIQSVRFDVSDPSKALDQARQAAMTDATHKAQQLAGLASAKLGPVLTISENSQAPIPFAAAQVQGGVGSTVPISPGTQAITVNLQVTWELTQP